MLELNYITYYLMLGSFTYVAVDLNYQYYGRYPLAMFIFVVILFPIFWVMMLWALATSSKP